jgi:hypothetical protein
MSLRDDNPALDRTHGWSRMSEKPADHTEVKEMDALDRNYALRLPRLAAASVALAALVACGGGGSGGGGAPAQGGAAPTTGTVGVLLTDGPTEDFCQVRASIERIDLLGAGGPVNVFTGPETVDVLAMRNYTDFFAIDTAVPVGSYDKVRLTLSDLALVECDAEGNPEPESGWEHPRLPGNGKLDLNPRGTFQVVGGETLVIELDMDMEKSLHAHQTGNGKWQFRPVVFVTIRPDDTKLVRVFGQVRDLDGTRFELCPTEPASSTDDDSNGMNGDMSADDDSGRCLDVFTDGDTGMFGEDGLPGGTLADGGLLTAIGFLSVHDDDDDDDSRMDDLRLDAVVLELGDQGTFERIAGSVVSAPGSNDIFVFDPTPADPATDAFDVLLQSGTRIFALGSNGALTSAALQPGTAGEVDGVFTDPATRGEPLRAALIVLEQGAQAPAVSLLDRTIASKTAATPATVPPSGRIDLTPTDPAADFDCATTTVDTRFLLITEAAGSSETSEIDFDALAAGDAVDVFGSDGGSGCVLADTIQKYVAAP